MTDSFSLALVCTAIAIGYFGMTEIDHGKLIWGLLSPVSFMIAGAIAGACWRR